jgi:adenosylcobinamide hydrolase
MKAALVQTAILVFLLPCISGARDIALPDSVNAKAFVLEAKKDGLWEKSLVVRFPDRRRLLSTNAGFLDVPAAVNHAAHPTLWHKATSVQEGAADEGKLYEEQVGQSLALSLDLAKSDMALMSTAADMDNLAVATRTYPPFVVTALVTAGAKSNALRAGVDEGTFIESDSVFEKDGKAQQSVPHGTVNIMILTNARLSDGAMARAIIMATEAKTAAFEDLRVPSSYHRNVQATGTGTDSMIVVSGSSGPIVTYTGGHGKIGELIAKAVHDAVIEALGKQNGFRKAHGSTTRITSLKGLTHHPQNTKRGKGAANTTN